MKRFIILFFLLFLPLSLHAADVPTSDYTLYLGSGCQHCAKVEEYLSQNPPPAGVEIKRRDIYQDKTAAGDFNAVADKLGISVLDRAVPTLVTPAGEAISGDTAIIAYFEKQWFGRAAQSPPLADESTGCKASDLNCSQKNQPTRWPAVIAVAGLLLLGIKVIYNGTRLP